MRRILLYFLLLLFSNGFVNGQNAVDSSLTLGTVFSDHMVLQRNKPIVIYGKVKGGSQVTISFLNKKHTVISDDSGQWKAVFPAMKKGGPFEILVKANERKVTVSDVVIGDVWICSGQSNMEFPLEDSKTGTSELNQTNFDTNIRLLRLGGITSTGNVSWDFATLEKINRFEFFSGSWQKLNAISAASFSAVAYYFGKKIATENDIPIGLIQVAVGGSPTESWIDESLLKKDDQIAGMFKNWQDASEVMEWCRQRAAFNLADAKSDQQKHPFHPGYNFKAGIAPLTDFPITGVIWYQGESNVHDVELHERLFEMLVKSWRQKWGYQFPFYYVQLSSIERPLWPEFRDSQRKMLAEIPNLGMAVSYDLGDSLNVHPVQKKEVGERLGALALKNVYHKKITATGPIPKRASVKHDMILLDFSFAKKLTTPYDQVLTGFELISQQGKRLPANATIMKNKVTIVIPAGEKITTVLYAYQPFTRANLYNEAGLPASTFSILVK
ncbi:sialate O-acetylesterase [Dyadobacter subterraneus]|uniref:Sialate O-acetylesterase n=1 Tax=Dyadobacter subterraneus TaxID=2773304 RepID=A0ABR9WDR9_9BACT|nr:sialate O-acetylesterase [Dyadobacter subterraneus]MBE9463625.1 sialate O-acetylesterase [Dyadobacter subterraneus]